MADEKKSILIYTDLIHTIKKLIEKDRKNNTNNCGELFYHILQYTNDLNPEPINDVVDFTFEPIKQQLKRDLVKYEGKKKFWSDAGKASAEAKRLERARLLNSTKSTSVENVQRSSTESTVNVSVNVNDNVIVTTTKEDEFISQSLESQRWLEAVCMKAKIKIIDVPDLFVEYKIHLIATGENHLNLKDFQSHFVYWVMKKPKQTASNKKPAINYGS